MANEVSFDDLIPSKSQSTTAPTSKGFDLSFDDLVPKKDTSLTGQFKAGGEAFVRGLPSTGGFWAGAAAGGTIVAPYAASIAPAAPVVAGAVELLGGLTGGVITSFGVGWATDKLSALMDPVGYAKWKQTQEQYPKATLTGSFASGFAGSSWKTAPEVAGKLMTKPIVQRGTSGTLMGAFDATQQYIQTGTVDPKMVAASAAGGVVLPGANVAGRVAQKIGTGTVNLLKPSSVKTSRTDIPDAPPPGATAEEIAKFKAQVEQEKAKRDANSPLVEAAIRNKKTGEIERMGPKHDQQRKADTVDTHDQGFVTERGQFLTREEAVDHAKRTGQIPQDHVLENPPGEQPGLHSGDLRKAGDERFAITEDQPAGEAKSSVAPTTRQEHKDAISKLEEEAYMTLEVHRQEALNTGDKKAVAEIEAQQAKLEQQIKDLQKSMPSVSFKDKALPTWEELHDHLWGSRSVGAAFDKILAVDGLGTRGQRALLKVLNQSEFIRNASLEFKNDYLKYTDPKDGKEKDATGLYTGGDIHRVELGKEGNVQVLAHEAMHAGTQKLLEMGNSVAAKKLQDLQERFAAEHERRYQEALEQFQRDNIAPTIGELKAFEKQNRKPYGFTNVHEFVAEAFTNKDFKQILASVKATDPQTGVLSNLWQDFKNIVREGLNIPEGERTAFDEAMEYGAALIEESKGFQREGATPTIPSKVSTTFASEKVIEATGEIVGKPDKPNPRDVKDEKEFIKIATDIYEKHGEVEAVEFFKGWKEFKATWAEPIKEVEKFVGINLNSKVANDRIIHNNTSDLKEMAGKDVNLEQLTYDIDKGTTLVGKAKEVADKFRSLMDELGKRALENDVIKGWHEDYVARNIVTEGTAPKGALEEFIRDAFGYGEKASGTGTKTTTKYGEPRRLKTREDLVNHLLGINSWLESKGLDYRFKLKTDNLADIYKDYALSVEKAIENKKLIENIKQIRNVNGESLIKPITDADPLPYGWKQIDHSNLAGYAIHPDLVAPLKFVFDAGPGMTMQALGTVSQAVKRINVIGSFFHAKSLMEVLGSANIPMWTPIKEAIVLPLVEKGVKAVTGKDVQLSAISKAVEQFKQGGLGDSVDTWVRKDGLQLEIPEDVSKGILSSTGKLVDSLIGKYGPKTRILEKSLSTIEKYTLGVFDKYTWDYLHTGGKIMVAEAYLEKVRLQAAKEGKPFNEAASRKEIAQFVNDSFGGLNWFEAARNTENEFAKRMAMAAYSPEGRRALQVVLFAPDWTISTLRAFTAALPKNLNPTKWQPVEGIKGMMAPTTKADYARLYQFKTALLYLTLINAINNMTADRNIWDNKDPTRVEWPDGTSMQAMKHAMEPYHWIADPDKTLANKLGFIPKAVVIGLGGVEYASPTAPKLVDLSVAGRGKAALSTALPFQIQAGASAPEGEGAQRALLGTMGFPVYGKTAEQNKQARAERELATKENAWKYRDNEIKKGRMQWTPKHDQEKRALDKRRQKLNKEAD